MSKALKQIRYLLIRLTHIQILGSQAIKQSNVYFSFGFLEDETMHYSSCISKTNLELNDTILMELKNYTLPQSIQLHRWQNHMIMFTFDINMSELKTRTAMIKKLQTKSHEVLTVVIRSLSQSQLLLDSSYSKNTCQHYLIVQQMQLRNYNIKEDGGPSYLMIKCADKQYCAPTVNSKITLPFPANLQFCQYRNNQLFAQSKIFRPYQLTNSSSSVQLFNRNKNTENANQSEIKLKLKWGIDLQQVKPQNYLLLNSEDILLYDLQIKFDNPNQFANAKARLVYGSKVFQISNDFNNAKTIKIKKIIQLTTKTDNQIAFIQVQKNSKVIAYCKINVQQIQPFSAQSIKQKIFDINEKLIGNIKLKGQKVKCLSTPQNNKIWKESMKNKNINIGSMQIYIDQISVQHEKFQQLQLGIKAEGIDDIILEAPNIRFFNKNKFVNGATIALNLKQDQTIYIMIKQVSDTDEKATQIGASFIGMALLNPSQLKLGSNCTQIQFYKNQQPSAKLNCIVNKILPYPFIKSTFHPEMLRAYIPHKFITVSLILNKILFTSYFYSYRYDNKNEVYCIVQINKEKKVLILEWDKTNSLLCNTSNSSDNLDFDVETTDIIKVKLTVLVSDVGQEQEIYGVAYIKISLSQLNKVNNGIKYKQIGIKNNFDQTVGVIDIEAHRGSLYNSHVKQSRDILQTAKNSLIQLKRDKPNLSKVSQSMQIPSSKNKNKQESQFMKQIRLNTQSQSIQSKPNKSYRVNSSDKTKVSQQRKRKNNSISAIPEIKQSVKLPPIREQQSSPINRKSYDSITKLINMRKNQGKGKKQEKLLLQSYKLINYQQRMKISRQKSNISSDLVNLRQKIEKQNPNLPRNLQILFPKKSPRIQKRNISKKSIEDEEQNFKSFKSVIKQINDIGQIEPSVNDNKSIKHSSRGSFKNLNKNSKQIN